MKEQPKSKSSDFSFHTPFDVLFSLLLTGPNQWQGSQEILKLLAKSRMKRTREEIRKIKWKTSSTIE
jgi:hypothetical protein